MLRIPVAFVIALSLTSHLWSRTVRIYRVGNSHSVIAALSGVLPNWHMDAAGQRLREGNHNR